MNELRGLEVFREVFLEDVLRISASSKGTLVDEFCDTSSLGFLIAYGIGVKKPVHLRFGFVLLDLAVFGCRGAKSQANFILNKVLEFVSSIASNVSSYMFNELLHELFRLFPIESGCHVWVLK